MRVSLLLTAAEVEALHQVAKQSLRTLAGEVTWAVLSHIKANGYVKPQAPEPPSDDPEDDEHPF